MKAFWRYWFLQSWGRFYHGGLSVIQSVEDEIAVVDTARNITKPLFQDYTRQGRILGFFFRLIRIFIGLVAFAAIIVAYAILYVIWLLLPIICLISIIGAFAGGSV